MTNIKDSAAISAMREGGKILATIADILKNTACVGMTTGELNMSAEALMEKYGVIPSFKGYQGFPGVLCASVNEEVVHAIPGKKKLQDGDLLKIDIGIIHKGYHTDHAVIALIGNVKPEVRKFADVTVEALFKGIEQVKPGNKTSDISRAVQKHIESHGYSIVREFTGHGIGRNLHEAPEIPNFSRKDKGYALIPGMTICIEPIVAMGDRFFTTLDDDWTAVTKDGAPACQAEHTILVTDSGYEILTLINS